MVSTFKELLKIGRYNLENFRKENDNKYEKYETGIEEHLNIDIMLKINKYMYTTYSSNKNDNHLSIGGVIPLDVYIKIQEELKNSRYYYVAANLKTKEILGSNLFNEQEAHNYDKLHPHQRLLGYENEDEDEDEDEDYVLSYEVTEYVTPELANKLVTIDIEDYELRKETDIDNLYDNIYDMIKLVS